MNNKQPHNKGLEQMRRVGVPAARAIIRVSPHSSTQCWADCARGRRRETAWLATLGVALAVTAQAASSSVYAFGRLGKRLDDTNIADIASALGSDGAPWAVRAWYSQILPTVWYADAHLPPTLSAGRLRRGLLVRLECRPATRDAECHNWVRASGSAEWVQVLAAAPPRSAPPSVPSVAERPSRVEGRFSDQQLLSLVDFIRASPTPDADEDGRLSGFTVSGDLPIQDILRHEDGSVWVVLSGDGGIGETATVQESEDGWVLQSVVGWVA
jgi:hypothetical protein